MERNTPCHRGGREQSAGWILHGPCPPASSPRGIPRSKPDTIIRGERPRGALFRATGGIRRRYMPGKGRVSLGRMIETPRWAPLLVVRTPHSGQFSPQLLESRIRAALAAVGSRFLASASGRALATHCAGRAPPRLSTRVLHRLSSIAPRAKPPSLLRRSQRRSGAAAAAAVSTGEFAEQSAQSASPVSEAPPARFPMMPLSRAAHPPSVPRDDADKKDPPPPPRPGSLAAGIDGELRRRPQRRPRCCSAAVPAPPAAPDPDPDPDTLQWYWCWCPLGACVAFARPASSELARLAELASEKRRRRRKGRARPLPASRLAGRAGAQMGSSRTPAAACGGDGVGGKEEESGPPGERA